MSSQQSNTYGGFEHALHYVTFGNDSASWLDRMVAEEDMASAIGITLAGVDDTCTHPTMQVQTFDLSADGGERRDAILKTLRAIQGMDTDVLKPHDIRMSAVFERTDPSPPFSPESPGKPLMCTRNFLQAFESLPRPLIDPEQEAVLRNMRIKAQRLRQDDSGLQKSTVPTKRGAPTSTPPQGKSKHPRPSGESSETDVDASAALLAALETQKLRAQQDNHSTCKKIRKYLRALKIDAPGEVNQDTIVPILIGRCKTLTDEVASANATLDGQAPVIAEAAKDKAAIAVLEKALIAEREAHARDNQRADSEKQAAEEARRQEAERTTADKSRLQQQLNLAQTQAAAELRLRLQREREIHNIANAIFPVSGLVRRVDQSIVGPRPNGPNHNQGAGPSRHR